MRYSRRKLNRADGNVWVAIFVRAVFDTIGKGAVLEGDLEPGDGGWNYPIYKYELTYTKTSARSLSRWRRTTSRRCRFSSSSISVSKARWGVALSAALSQGFWMKQ